MAWTVKRLIDHEGVKSHNLKAFLVFTDFKKAFDSVHEGRVLQILRAYDIPEKQIDAIGLLYQGTKARTPDGETDFFEIQAGVLQGVVQSFYGKKSVNLPLIATEGFSTVLDSAMYPY